MAVSHSPWTSAAGSKLLILVPFPPHAKIVRYSKMLTKILNSRVAGPHHFIADTNPACQFFSAILFYLKFLLL
jgi:hypothetical protein